MFPCGNLGGTSANLHYLNKAIECFNARLELLGRLERDRYNCTFECAGSSSEIESETCDKHYDKVAVGGFDQAKCRVRPFTNTYIVLHKHRDRLFDIDKSL